MIIITVYLKHIPSSCFSFQSRLVLKRVHGLLNLSGASVRMSAWRAGAKQKDDDFDRLRSDLERDDDDE